VRWRDSAVLACKQSERFVSPFELLSSEITQIRQSVGLVWFVNPTVNPTDGLRLTNGD
jgi:hypothetical protein